MERHQFPFCLARDQQKWAPVLRPIARLLIKLAHDLIGEPVPTSPDHAQEITTFPPQSCGAAMRGPAKPFPCPHILV
jgi:hypothetical protein